MYIVVDEETKDCARPGVYRGLFSQVSGDFAKDHSCARLYFSDQHVRHKWLRSFFAISYVVLPRRNMCAQCKFLCRYNTQGNAATGLPRPFTESFLNKTRKELGWFVYSI